MGTQTPLGYRKPSGTDPNTVHVDIGRLADDVDASPGISAMSTAVRDALPAPALRAGRVIYNQTTGTLQRYSGLAWVEVIPGAWVSYTPSLRSSSNPQPNLGAGGQFSGRFVVIGKTCHFTATVIYGSTTIEPGVGTLSLVLPLAAATMGANDSVVIHAEFNENGGNLWAGQARIDSAATAARLLVCDGTYKPVYASWAGSLPPIMSGGWYVGDYIRVSGSYPIA